MERAREMFNDKLLALNARDDAEKNYEMAVNRQCAGGGNLGVASAAITRSEAQVDQARARDGAIRRGPAQRDHRIAD